jgi:hypothetical protein
MLCPSFQQPFNRLDINRLPLHERTTSNFLHCILHILFSTELYFHLIISLSAAMDRSQKLLS